MGNSGLDFVILRGNQTQTTDTPDEPSLYSALFVTVPKSASLKGVVREYGLRVD